MIPSGASLIAPKRPPKPPNSGEVASFQAAKAFLDGCITDLDSIDAVSTTLMNQLQTEKDHIVQEVRCKFLFALSSSFLLPIVTILTLLSDVYTTVYL